MPFHPGLVPGDIWEQIAYYVLEDTLVGPLSGLTALLLVCRWTHDSLCFANNSRLYARLFCVKFDCEAPRRRFSDRWFTAPAMAAELRKRLEMLRRVRQQTECTTQDLWTCYLMLLENDGRNERQLTWAQLPEYIANDILRQSSCTGSYSHTTMSLILWISWMMLTRERLMAESTSTRSLWINHILHGFLVAGFQFSSIYAPDPFLHLPISCNVHPLPPNISGPSPSVDCLTHFSHPLTVAAPVLTPAAMLCSTARQETIQELHPLHPQTLLAFPLDRQAAIAQGTGGLTVEDILEFHRSRLNYPVQLPLPPSSTFETFDAVSNGRDMSDNVQTGSVAHDPDWFRTVSCHNMFSLSRPLRGTVFPIGALNGHWAGRFLFTGLNDHVSLLNNDPKLDINDVEVFSKPLYWDLQEHHCMQPTSPLSPGVDECAGDDVLNAWLPRGFMISRYDNALHVTDPDGETVRYDTYNPESSNDVYSEQQQWYSDDYACGYEDMETEMKEGVWPIDAETSWHGTVDDGVDTSASLSEDYVDTVSQKSTGVADILVTGDTGPNHGAAWGHYSVVGRVRSWDGLIVLLQTPKHPAHTNHASWIFKGYLHGDNFVGRWRETTIGPNVVGYEGSFVVSRCV